MLIGITGTLGAGKGTVVEILKEKGFEHVAVSDTVLAGEAKKRGWEPNRQARHDVANEFRSQGPTKLMEVCFEYAKPLLEQGNDVVLEPQHTSEEAQFIKDKGGVMIAVNADIEIRYERIQKRGGAKDNVTFEEFKAHEEMEMHPTETTNNNLAGAIESADYVIVNNGDLEDLKEAVNTFLEKAGFTK